MDIEQNIRCHCLCAGNNLRIFICNKLPQGSAHRVNFSLLMCSASECIPDPQRGASHRKIAFHYRPYCPHTVQYPYGSDRKRKMPSADHPYSGYATLSCCCGGSLSAYRHTVLTGPAPSPAKPVA